MIERDLNIFDSIKSNSGYENKSKIEREYLSLKDKYKSSKSDCHNIMQLIMLGYEYGDQYIVPEYQRELVWTLEQKENLIKSILYGNPIGDFLFKKEFAKDEKGRINTLNISWSIIDGQQRINAIREFFTNKFEVDGKCFKDLKYWDARTFLDVDVSVISVQDITIEEEIEIYLNRNCGGTNHTKEEIEKVKLFLDSLNDNSFER